MSANPLGRLLCAIGRHAPVAGGLWNGGYCFTRCRRCQRDMVKSAFGEWHVPAGYRVVWRPPADGHGHAVGAAVVAPQIIRARRSAALSAGKAPARAAEAAADPFDFGEFERAGDRRWDRPPLARSIS